MTHWDAIVIGAGAAGMMCAFEAGRRGKRVLLLDHGEKPGRKILISGGGRANFTNTGTTAANYLSENPHFAKSALARFTPRDMIALVEKHGLRYHEKTLGQQFFDNSARELVTLLERECGDAGVITRCGVSILSVSKDGDDFVVESSQGTERARALVIATGGLSIPKLGATGFGYNLARQFGHSIIDTRAALVPLVFLPEDRDAWCDLTGTSAEVVVKVDAPSNKRNVKVPAFREKALITHRGLSGPAILQISSYWRPGQNISLDLAPGQEVFTPITQHNTPRDLSMLRAALRTALSQRLADRWLRLNEERIRFTNQALIEMEKELHAWAVRPAGDEGYEKAEVTAGGVDTNELNASTMESKRAPGLYFIGEVVDVTGWLGGYNFQWAWASAVAAGRSL
ncbi:NAD(P)/FAD-dependent oxidoreductase [Granulicella cerasi]|uniref:NAD(P)/FAD-dependent oxidoreductase n=1 Tax=Granulicella cerasi TaxID=741063 RepID=A0ABW1ZBA6_9BACT|nr:NAD(P)/FAD-dependent oxidoreductase [Granulicella cerasi]